MTAIKPDAIDRVLPAATPWLAVINCCSPASRGAHW